MTLEQILADKNMFADTIELTINNEKVNLGQLRELSTKQQQALSDKMAGADKREAEARDTATKAANLLAQLEEARAGIAAARTEKPTDDDFDKGDWWSPVRDRLAVRDKKFDALESAVGTLTKSVQQAATIWAKDRWRNQYDREAPRLKKVKEFENWDFDKVLAYATEKKVFDDDGMPSVERAIKELTKANEIETIRKEEYERGLQAGKNKARMDSMPRPSSASGAGKLPKGKSAVEEFGLEGLGDDVTNDADLMQQLGQLSELEM